MCSVLPWRRHVAYCDGNNIEIIRRTGMSLALDLILNGCL
jgi:hypothetical protein